MSIVDSLMCYSKGGLNGNYVAEIITLSTQ